MLDVNASVQRSAAMIIVLDAVTQRRIETAEELGRLLWLAGHVTVLGLVYILFRYFLGAH
jgi:hypothetical protein